ncbi:hypothetical protein [Xanthomonas bundabergensis]|uniref:hypothetical protein n=1 Tax=Xanthomonas bundabergensis TaxID=3160842 RepID=UPI0035174D10
MNTSIRRTSFYAACLLVQGLVLAPQARANSAWNLEFAFDGPGARPSVATLRNYILACVPARSVVNAPLPGTASGPFALTTPPINGRELTDAAVYTYLNGCNRKPASVTGIAVLGDD